MDLRKILLGSVMIGSQSGLVPVHPVPCGGSFILIKTNLKKTTRKRWQALMQCMVIAKCQVLALQYLRILQALSFFLQVAEFEASPGAEVAEAGAVFEQGLSKQSKVVLRSGRVQHGSTWFNDILLPHHCQSFCH